MFAHRLENGGAARFEFAQIIQALFQRAQLRVVERAGDFLAVARHERNRRAAIEQRHRRLDLLLADAEFLRNLSMNVYHAKSFLKQSRPDPSAAGTPLMDHHLSIHQPEARNKMFCGWRSFGSAGDRGCTKQLTYCAAR